MKGKDVNRLIGKYSKCEDCGYQNINYDVNVDSFIAKCSCG
jgi:predicted Zn-ribbon and HTH transcriptional regulator